MPDRPFIPAPNGGGWGEAATLLNAGIQAWDQNRRYKTDQQLAQDKQDADLMSKGYEKDADGKVKRNAITEADYQRDQAETDPNTPESANLRNVARGLVKQVNPALSGAITDDMPGRTVRGYLQQYQGLIGKEATGLLQGQRIDIQRGNQAVKAADTFDKDHILTQLTQQQQQIRRDTHTLETAETMTPQIFNEINLGIANAISGGKAAAVTTQGKVEYDSLALDYTRLKQRISNNPQDIGSPEVKKYTADILKRLDDAYSNNLYEQAQRLKNGRAGAYTNNPAAMNVLNDKAASYKQAEPQGLVDQNTSGPHGNTVYQNGHMFTWNPKTKAYE